MIDPDGVRLDVAYDDLDRAVSITGALLAPWPVILGVLLLVVDLGRQLRFYEMLLRPGPGLLMFSPTSTMSIGAGMSARLPTAVTPKISWPATAGLTG